LAFFNETADHQHNDNHQNHKLHTNQLPDYLRSDHNIIDSNETTTYLDGHLRTEGSSVTPGR
jgi:hypothetical protein